MFHLHSLLLKSKLEAQDLYGYLTTLYWTPCIPAKTKDLSPKGYYLGSAE